jgi:DNA (cytosine-5)-methyltransferase 1
LAHPPTIVDLFSGCGGFGLGAELAGFHTSVAVDIDGDLQSGYRLNFPSTSVVQADISKLDRHDWSILLPSGPPDGIIGGPPCQGFSRMGKRDLGDQRNSLIHAFYDQVRLLKPRFFVMENVEGILDSANADTLNSSIGLIGGHYDVFGPVVVDAQWFGAATRRRRVLVVGFRKDHSITDVGYLFAPTTNRSTVSDAISDLPPPVATDGEDRDFGWSVLSSTGSLSTYAKRARQHAPRGLGWSVARERHLLGEVSGFLSTAHTVNVQKRFSDLDPGQVDHISKYPKLSWQGVCPTLRAGTGRERGSFQAARPLHPEFPRVITVREAARLQGFPDWFVFHPTRWHSFRMIGNSVSPYVAETLLQRIKELIGEDGRQTKAA